MIVGLPSLYLLQVAAEMAQEGLPFWLFWFLLCVILLLLVFIFLRDKDLRRRMSSFLSGARRKMSRSRLRTKIRRIEARKTALWKELGQNAWGKDLRNENTESVCTKLKAIEEEIHVQQMKWHEAFSQVEGMNRRQEETRERFRAMLREEEAGRKPLIEEMNTVRARIKELMEASASAGEDLEAAGGELKGLDKEAQNIRENSKIPDAEKASRCKKADELKHSLLDWSQELRDKISNLNTEQADLHKKQKDTQARIDIFNRKIREITREHQEASRGLDKEIRETEKIKSKIQGRIIELKGHMDPLFENMGKALDKSRIENKDLEVFYFEIDGADKTIRDLEARVEKLR